MLRDGAGDTLQVQLLKWGESQSDVDAIWLENTWFDVGLGTVLLLQVVNMMMI